MRRGKAASIGRERRRQSPVRERIIAAAFAAFTEQGFAATRTLDIATRAGVSKRALYALFGSKQQILVSCIAERARRMRLPAGCAAPRTRAELEARLAEFGQVLLKEISEPEVIALFRLAVSEGDRSPEVGRALELHGRGAASSPLRELLDHARSAGFLVPGDSEALAGRFLSLLLDDLPLSLALGLRVRPGGEEIGRRAAAAARHALELAGAARKS